MAAHPNKRGIMVIRIVTNNVALVVGSTNPISIGDGGLLVCIKLFGEGFPELVLMLAVVHIIPSE